MIRYVSILLFFGLISAGSTPYISPGLQLGINSNGSFFISAQTTIGYVGVGFPSNFGITAGLRMYNNSGWKKYKYIDLQYWPFLMGFGIGKMIDESNNLYTRYKTGYGALGYFTYDHSKIPQISNHNFGFIGVLPFWDWSKYNPETG